MDLELVLTDDLIKELMRRNDIACFISNKSIVENVNNISVRWVGPIDRCLGLLEICKMHLLQVYQKEIQ